jgi:hypothetical protein
MAMIAEVTGWAATGDRGRPEVADVSDGWVIRVAAWRLPP